jgi:hypothetical protein
MFSPAHLCNNLCTDTERLQFGAGGGAGAWLERALLFALESDRMVVLTLSHVARADGW